MTRDIQLTQVEAMKTQMETTQETMYSSAGLVINWRLSQVYVLTPLELAFNC